MPADPDPLPEADRGRAARGVALTVPAALLAVAAATRLDAWLDLPGWGRGLLAAGWVVAVMVAGWAWAAAPARPNGARVGPAVAAFLALLSLALVPAAGERVRRLFLPFYTPIPDAAFRLVVSSGDPVVARGGSVTLTAFADPTRPGSPLPESATLLVREPGGPVQRTPMGGDGRGVFHATRADVTTDFEYAAEAGETRTDWHTVNAVEPVGIADGGTVGIDAPNYARASRPARTASLAVPFDVPQFGLAAFEVPLTRAAVDAYLDWRPASGPPIHRPLVLAPDRRSARGTLSPECPGGLKVVLLAERGVRTEVPVPMRVVADAPPRFETATGLGPGPREVAPDGTIRGDLGVRDDLGVAAVRLEFDVNGGPPRTAPGTVSLSGVGTPQADGGCTLPLAGRVREGDTLRVRVRATDNRSVPSHGFSPQNATFPPDGWAEFRIVRSPARPLAEQDVLAWRDRVKGELVATAAAMEHAHRRVSAVAGEAKGATGLSVDQTARVTESRDEADATAQRLERFAAEVAVEPDLRPLAGTVRGVADGPLRAAVESLRAAHAATGPAGRDPAVAAAVAHLRAAADKLAAFAADADRSAQSRLDRRALAAVAADLRAYAGGPPTADAARDREAFAQRLAAVVAASPPLADAAVAAELDALRATSSRTGVIAHDHRRLIAAAAETARVAQDRTLGGLAAKQADLAAVIAAFARRTETAARLADAAPLSPRPGTDSVALLRANRTTEAAAEQEKAAREVERLAETFAKTADARSDAKEAARQLVRWQTDLRQRSADATGAATVDREHLAAEQRAIRDAIARLQLPDGAALADARTAATATAGTAADALTPAAFAEATDKLRTLADQTPSRDQRWRTTRDAIDGLIREQDTVARWAEEALKAAGNLNPDGPGRTAVAEKAAAAADRQEALARAAAALDAPGLEHRRAAAADAARRAAADLRAGQASDIPVSQAAARRQFDRFRQAADGTVPNDERAADLARLQRVLSAAAARLPATPTDDEFRPLRQSQRQLALQFASLKAPEAAALLADARAAVGLAAGQANPAEFRTQVQAAADALTRLADRLTGAETDCDRVSALARARAAATDKAKLAPRTPPATEEAAETARLLQRDAEELTRVRVGTAQGARKRAVEAMARLRQAPDADRQPQLQQAAADALSHLAGLMKNDVERTAGHALSSKPAATDPTGAGDDTRLPTRADADAARDLARRQRALRDDVLRSAVELGHGVRPGTGDPISGLARDQSALAEEMGRYDPSAASTARRAADALRFGATTEARDSASAAAKACRQSSHRDLAERQTVLADRMAVAEADLPSRAARLRNELSELTRRCVTLAAELDHAAVRVRGTRTGANAEQLSRTADALRRAADELTLAARETAAGRPSAGADAHRRAAAAFAEAVEMAASTTPPPAPKDEATRSAIAAVRRAEDALRATDASAVRQAADAITEAVRCLVP